MSIRSRLQMIISVSLSSLGAFYLAYLCWSISRSRKRRKEVCDSDGEEDPDRRRSRSLVSSSDFDTNILWNVIRPVITQVIASALQDKTTQTAFRSLCIAVLTDDKMKTQFREVVSDVFLSNSVQESLTACIVALMSSPKVGKGLATILQSACVDDQTATGLAKVLAKTLAITSRDNHDSARKILSKTLLELPVDPAPASPKRSCSNLAEADDTPA